MERLSITCLLVALARAYTERDCPKEGSVGTKSDGGGQGGAKLTLHNSLDVDVIVYWVNFNGEERSSGNVMPEDDHTETTSTGHLFRVRSWAKELLLEHKVGKNVERVDIVGCKDFKPEGSPLWEAGRDEEFEALVHKADDHPCLPEHKSGSWSCVKYWTREEYLARNKSLYGFQEGEVPDQRVHLTWDSGYTGHIPKMPKFVPGGAGYLKMSMSQRLKDVVLEWYRKRSVTNMKVHETIAGGYTNNDKVLMDKVNLDDFRDVQSAVAAEMQQVLQWWTKKKLKHTSTFGARVYRRGSMLIDHVDRQDTHHASAVLQLDQEVDEDGGWPLEVLLPEGRAAEVYLQPGEMVLYEGAWLRHGRPMRLKGNMFANIFTHFAPLDWKGQFPYESNGMKGPYLKGRCNTLADEDGQGCHVKPEFQVNEVEPQYGPGTRFASEHMKREL